MAVKSCLAGLAFLLATGVAHAAEECPSAVQDIDEVILLLNKARGCDRAMKLFGLCNRGSSGDIRFGAVVEKKCEADFLSRLEPPQKLAYQREMRTCVRKYQNEDGTMYRSFTALCRAEVAQRYSRRMRKTAGSLAR